MRPSEMMLTNNNNAFLLLLQTSDFQYFVLFLVLYILNGELSGNFLSRGITPAIFLTT
jgi:hypothetical protein